MENQNKALVWKLSFGIFGILTTELGVVGILPLIADTFHVSVTQAGWLVSIFALGVALAGPVMPLLFSGVNRKTAMLGVQGIFVLSNLVCMVTDNFTVLLLARLIPALCHPVYCTLAFTIAAETAGPRDASKAVARIMMGVSAGMVFGVPISSLIAGATSFSAVMLFFAAVNAVAFMLTLLAMPSMPVGCRVAYGTQLSLLRSGLTWISLATVALIAASMASVYSYVADYLKNVAQLAPHTLSLTLLLFGLASICGNPVAGRLLSTNPLRAVFLFPFVLGVIYIALYFVGASTLTTLVLACLWGVVYGAGNNFQQYWIASALPDSPELATGLFLSFGNIGITLGTTIGGMFIAGMGIRSIILGGLVFLALTFVSILIRNLMLRQIPAPVLAAK